MNQYEPGTNEPGGAGEIDFGVPLGPLQKDPSVIYILDKHLRIAFCNPSWDRFAMENGGHHLLGRDVKGLRVLDVIEGRIRQFYEEAYVYAKDTGNPWEHDYECSSPDDYRLFRMRILPLTKQGGFLVVNTVIVARPHAEDRSKHPPGPTYEKESGILTMCCHCRRTKRADGSGVWDWVPEYLRFGTANISHGICPPCFAYYYPDLREA